MFHLRPHTEHRTLFYISYYILNRTLEKKLLKIIRKISEDKRIFEFFEDVESSIDCDIK